MADPLGGSLNELEARVARLEQSAVRADTRPAALVTDDVGTTTVQHALDWSAANNLWEPWSQLAPITPPDAAHPVWQLSTQYGLPEASLLGGMCVLTGLVRRKAGAPNLTAGTRWNQPLFGLPADWRPLHTVILPCLMGNADPGSGTTTTFGTAWIEIRADYDTTPPAPSGRVYAVAGTSACNATTGWIALQGLFPCQILPAVPLLNEGSWDDISDYLTWDQVADGITWDSYPNTV